MTRTLLILHRYLGVVIGLLMVLWCLSGFVMMYQGYPRLTELQRLRGLAPLDPAAVATLQAITDEPLASFTIEMRAGAPVLFTRTPQGAARARSMVSASGAEAGGVDTATALAVAQEFGTGAALAGRARLLARIDFDQWTVEGARSTGPLYRLGFDDPAHTELYVAARTGQVTQVTTRRARTWAWFGAIPHWLYPLALRRNAALWDQVVVWTSLLGVFLTVTGVWVGIAHFHPLRAGRWSPFRGWYYWHHLAGLVAGLLVLSWVASGLFTMNPWGFLDTDSGAAQRAQLAGSVSPLKLRRFLASAARLDMHDVVQLQSVPLNGRLFVLAVRRDGTSRRLDPEGAERPLTAAEVAAALTSLVERTHAGPVAQFEKLGREDSYYYSNYDGAATLPVYRAQLADADATRLYLDAESGQLVAAFDRVARESRWLRTGLHDMDFTAGLRRRPLWDAVVLLLLAAVTAVCSTGAWLSLKRVKRDALVLTRRLRVRRATR